MKLRINYIDNLRTIMIFLLIPYHLAMAYNIWGEPNYIFLEGNKAISSIVVFMSPWFINDMYNETIHFKKKKATTFIKLTFGNK